MNVFQAIKRVNEIEDVLWHTKKLKACLEGDGYEFENKIIDQLQLKFEQEAADILNSKLSKIEFQ